MRFIILHRENLSWEVYKLWDRQKCRFYRTYGLLMSLNCNHQRSDTWPQRAMAACYWQGKTEELGVKPLPSATLSTANPTWTDPGLNSDLHGEKPPTYFLSHGTANLMVCCSFTWPTSGPFPGSLQFSPPFPTLILKSLLQH